MRIRPTESIVGPTCCIQIGCKRWERLERVGLERNLQNKKAGGKLCAGNGPAPIPLDESGGPLRKISQL